MHRLTRYAALALSLLAGLWAAADAGLHVIELKHRPADEIIPLVRPLLGPGDAISGTGFQLILRASEQRRREIERLLDQVDVAPRQWTLTVRQTVVSDRQTSRYSVSGKVQAGREVTVTATRPGAAEGAASAEASSRQGQVRVDTDTVRTATRDEQRQILQVRDGQRAYLRVGQSAAQIRTILALTGRPLVVSPGVELTGVTTGFDILPRARGDLVHIEITPRLAAADDPTLTLMSFQELTTTVTVRPGAWVDLGLLGGSGEDIRRAFVDGTASREGERRTVLIRLD